MICEMMPLQVQGFVKYDIEIAKWCPCECQDLLNSGIAIASFILLDSLAIAVDCAPYFCSSCCDIVY